jgi:transcriptional regulator with PAS, ATPase and Fis domain
MLADTIHRLSPRKTAPFLAVNMASFSKTLFEDEFFGHTKGAYTDAREERAGFFETSHGGTLFLDEIAELELSLQGKLLRVIEEREFYRLGSTQAKNIDVRIIAATNRDINQEIRDGTFRADLFYRLNMYSITIPPLRERRKDILPLARHFLKIYTEDTRKSIGAISRELADRLIRHSFPGNVRELGNIIAAAVLSENGRELSLEAAQSLLPTSDPNREDDDALMTLEEVEKRHILKVLRATRGNRTEAARLLGVNPSTVYRKIEKYGLDA